VSVTATELRPAGLDDLTRFVLDFERSWRGGGRSKERGIREGLGISPTRYHQVLVRAIESPDALAYDPMLVRRLRRLRDVRRRARLRQRLGRPSPHG
jgi:hypothetical protein